MLFFPTTYSECSTLYFSVSGPHLTRGSGRSSSYAVPVAAAEAADEPNRFPAMFEDG